MAVGAGSGSFHRREIAAQFLAARKTAKLTQRQAAAKLRVDPSAVSRWERGETLPSLANIPSLADLYGFGELDLQRKINLAQAEEIVDLRADNADLKTAITNALSEFRAVTAEVRGLMVEIRKGVRQGR